METTRPVTQVVTSNSRIRFSYAYVWEPRVDERSGRGKYQVCILIPKDDAVNIKLFKDAIEAARALGVSNGKYGGKPTNVPSFKLPMRDGDLEKPGDEVYKGHYFINAGNDKPVGVLGRNGKRISDFERDTFYSGCYGNVAVNFFPYNFEGTIGVGCGLNGVQKVHDGERLSGIPDPETLFGAVEGESDLL